MFCRVSIRRTGGLEIWVLEDIANLGFSLSIDLLRQFRVYIAILLCSHW